MHLKKYVTISLATLFCCVGVASASAELDETSLKNSVITRVQKVLATSGKTEAGTALTPEMIQLEIVQPMRIGTIQLYAVKLTLQNPLSAEQVDVMSLLVDETGQTQYTAMDIATGADVGLGKATEVNKLTLPDSISASTFYVGSGKNRVIFISDPFCPYCRHAYDFIQQYKSKIKDISIVHLPLEMHPGADMASWIMEYSADRHIQFNEVVNFAYTELQLPDKSLSQIDSQKNVLSQFIEKFPDILDGGTSENLFYLLKGKYGDSTITKIKELERLNIKGTPVIIINNQPVHGFNKSEIISKLNS